MTDEIPSEFAMIARHLRPLAGPGGLNLEDDAAVLECPLGRSLVIAADALVAGIHFHADERADLIARKLLRTNLSDLAAMGAVPFGYLVTISVPADTEEGWFAGFAAGLLADQTEFGLQLLGGDTTSTVGPISLSLTILGSVAPGTALRRSGANPGDSLYVSGTIGDGALGLLAIRGDVRDRTGALADRYRVPQPRLALGQRLIGIASAAMDVSDGLIQDVGHLCRASGVSAKISADLVPLSDAARDAGQFALCLTGGDDYELAFAVPAHREPALSHLTDRAGVQFTRIGQFGPGPPGVAVTRSDGSTMRLTKTGWNHLA